MSSTQFHEDGHGISPCPDTVTPTVAQGPITNHEAVKEQSSHEKKDSTEDDEVASNPRGIRFAILFLSILAGDFFVGYVRYQSRHTV